MVRIRVLRHRHPDPNLRVKKKVTRRIEIARHTYEYGPDRRVTTIAYMEQHVDDWREDEPELLRTVVRFAVYMPGNEPPVSLTTEDDGYIPVRSNTDLIIDQYWGWHYL